MHPSTPSSQFKIHPGISQSLQDPGHGFGTNRSGLDIADLKRQVQVWEPHWFVVVTNSCKTIQYSPEHTLMWFVPGKSHLPLICLHDVTFSAV